MAWLAAYATTNHMNAPISRNTIARLTRNTMVLNPKLKML